MIARPVPGPATLPGACAPAPLFRVWLSAACLLPLLAGCSASKPRVVLYCAQDQEFAEKVLSAFTQRTGLAVDPKYDTEATKSVGLYVELVQEKDRPRCDVHWNNEILSTIRLQRQGLLDPYASPSAKPYPAWTQAKDQTWHAFASRARAAKAVQVWSGALAEAGYGSADGLAYGS